MLAGATDPQGIMATLLVLGLTAIVVDGLAAFAIARTAQWSAPARWGSPCPIPPSPA